jgi:HSP20 family molecular chaperone IbpA
MALPSDVNEEEIKAKYENGELIITLPKKLEEKTNSKKIAID